MLSQRHTMTDVTDDGQVKRGSWTTPPQRHREEAVMQMY